ncbi:GNAT family N-acetyltransferase [Prescottella agglutinans]|uniref:GNAT family N-acetyltransferase n=1 Tax=Prescottella agglutinans TaxID=1644129 RepID=A0A3S3CYY2_9NOCA|nr:GNAT family N-acetyltransferase [Prescottella agglutinans]RVW09052.1 GNAT family N-acetyltransferase [Prescottella agglutinans]
MASDPRSDILPAGHSDAGGSRGSLLADDWAEIDDPGLDHPVHFSLAGAHAHLSRTVGRAGTYAEEVSTFCSVPADPEPADWDDLARLLGPGGFADLFSCPELPPAHWDPVFSLDGLQMVAPPATDWRPVATEDDVPAGCALVELGPADLPEMLELVTETRPGPFWPRTPEFGTYLGIRQNGTLVAMAGERLRPPGWTEISAVCTAPAARGQGHAARLVRELTDRISARGDRAFLHVAGTNTQAISVYRGLGFRPRREVTFRGFRIP